TVSATRLEADNLQEAATSGDSDAVSPDSALWLDQIDRAWQAQHETNDRLTGSLSRYALSPVVIAAPEQVARSLNYPDQPVRWATILDLAASQPSFRWGHPSNTTSMGMLVTIAE